MTTYVSPSDETWRDSIPHFPLMELIIVAKPCYNLAEIVVEANSYLKQYKESKCPIDNDMYIELLHNHHHHLLLRDHQNLDEYEENYDDDDLIE
jgi:hypothetical protein